MQPHPLPRPFTAAAPLAGGEGATPPPAAPPATARSPRAVATIYDTVFPDENGPLEKAAAEAWFYDQLDVIDSHAFDTLDALGEAGLIRRWVARTTSQERAEQKDAILREWRKATAGEAPSTIPVQAERREGARERRLVDERPIFTPAELAEIEAEMEAGIGLSSSCDRWPEPGGDSFRALTDRDWRQETGNAGDDLPGPWFVATVIVLASGFATAFGVGLARLVAVLL